ncbi:uncharacterized protein BO97DRAFT_446326 [Aspergillus homomorphus CBS 101889]|uniref:Uncharacterized protein n=1 Tax=Aspergillus homomorphus (strain CBS 101889) TaxID=1450537 RepID=A0A395HK51_ASPHC|nr:hypothetical protein BO97DRAFT_446326 [Aspergillus homomorphus CBS 101889]RAL08150.1 hypothetical protein BO97DRAFT_446326 [Aspergillus homomorphus CBS 101889]
MALQSVVPGPSSLVHEPDLGGHGHPDVLPLLSDLLSMKSPPSSPDHGTSNGPENDKIRAALQRMDSRETDTFQIFPMDVDSNPSLVTAYNANDRETGSDIQRSSPILMGGPMKENVPCDVESRKSTTTSKLNEHFPSAMNEILTGPEYTGSPDPESVHKPPKPPKPAFLSELELPTTYASGDVQPSVLGPEAMHQGKKPAATGPQSLASREGARAPLRLLNRSMGRLQGHDAPKQIRKPGINPRPLSWRILSRPLADPNTRIYVKDEPKMPLLAPSPMAVGSPLRHNFESPDTKGGDSIPLPVPDGSRQDQPQGQRFFGELLTSYIRKPFQAIWLRTQQDECAIVSLLVGQRSEQHLLSQSKSCSFHVHVNWPIAKAYAKSRDDKIEDTFVSYSSTAHLVKVEFIVPIIFLQIICSLKAGFRRVITSPASSAVVGLLQVFLRFAAVVLLFFLGKLGVSVSIRRRGSHNV